MATTRRSRCSSSSRRACPAARFCSSTNTSQPTAAARQATTITLMTTHPFRTATGLPWFLLVPLRTLRTDRESGAGQSNSGTVPRSPSPPRAPVLPPRQHPSLHQSLCPPVRPRCPLPPVLPRCPLPQHHRRLRLLLPSMATDAAPGAFLGAAILRTNLRAIGAMRMQANAKAVAAECGSPPLRRPPLPPGHLL